MSSRLAWAIYQGSTILPADLRSMGPVNMAQCVCVWVEREKKFPESPRFRAEFWGVAVWRAQPFWGVAGSPGSLLCPKSARCAPTRGTPQKNLQVPLTTGWSLL